MPTYDYRCKACGKTFEYFQSMKDDPLTTCILCGKSGEVDRLISNVGGIIFKGSGFYVTDNKSSGSKGSDSSGSSGSSSSG
ncbi:zinc ribbon domain-containing protein [Leptospira wolffii]|uniref:FmdB family zinc ribbon protein n=1 Tax=Leptospira wolffii TaxID=409998 RepID=UPI001084111C|nr:zinc ribbon domain-containing protein [Leptospira wolffii]TGK56217.1 zinc ribbon domain-containing protein [Leptospira wolffii]TGK72264.1 zinc ribbon domain-containing protein [Leptospira wolffii]TGK72830.1 zinc ribbon domain-containing protein [Leptospira wolffii]TGL27841.1 zinc ribbon domain-containing protein [Leptospira wolffii]